MQLPTLLLLGSGELGKEVAISAKRLGCRVVAVDSYDGAPAMQVSDAREVIDMLHAPSLRRVVRRHLKPGVGGGFIVPEIEAIRTEELLSLERLGYSVVPSARAANLTMNRDAIRDLAASRLRLPTARYAYAESAAELRTAITAKKGTGLPAVVKPVMSSSGKGQSVVTRAADIDAAWTYAVSNMRGDRPRVIAEEFIEFDYEITLLTVRQRRVVAGRRVPEPRRTLFVRPIGHRQERGDYQESWMPCPMKPALIRSAQRMARTITAEIAGPEGAGLFGVEFFVRGNEVIFSELSPRPHDTGMVTMISQDLSEFDLHVRAILGLPIPAIRYEKAAASAVILSPGPIAGPPEYPGLGRALAASGVQIRLFGKPSARKYRRMGVALAVAASAAGARKAATRAASLVRVEPGVTSKAAPRTR
ncbi:MAG: formate-dependent phosphoribosylglycinamide formyltransferase [Leptolyngbya sp. PLA1]|nr:formate-dependent phosphoribosylglycinamide formyltransferase [Leptolyngbya sp. PLA1]